MWGGAQKEEEGGFPRLVRQTITIIVASAFLPGTEKYAVKRATHCEKGVCVVQWDSGSVEPRNSGMPLSNRLGNAVWHRQQFLCMWVCRVSYPDCVCVCESANVEHIKNS